jgi:hypothetical protein
MRAVYSRAFAVWVMLIVAESIHGTMREVLLKPRVGDLRARQICLFTGMLIILGVASSFIRWVRAETTRSLLFVGLMWMAFTLIFEFSLGLFLGYSGERMLSDYNLPKGGFMGFGLLFLVSAPLLAARLRGTIWAKPGITPDSR